MKSKSVDRLVSFLEVEGFRMQRNKKAMIVSVCFLATSGLSGMGESEVSMVSDAPPSTIANQPFPQTSTKVTELNYLVNLSLCIFKLFCKAVFFSA